ncbi:MAG: hypothetical protein RIS08_990 [Actinomycetota bacterium]|jgi:hypothetical protein
MRQVDELWIGEIPPQHLASVEDTLAAFVTSFSVSRLDSQPNFQISGSPALDVFRRAELASALSRLGFPFELLHLGQDSERYSFLPSLGIHRVSLNEIGEEQLSLGRIEELLRQSGGSSGEFRTLLNRAVGEPWKAAIEVIRENERLRVA